MRINIFSKEMERKEKEEQKRKERKSKEKEITEMKKYIQEKKRGCVCVGVCVWVFAPCTQKHTQWSFQMRFCLTWSGSLGNRTTATVMASAMNLFALLRASVLPAASSHAGLTDGSGLYWIPRCLHAESCSHRESAFEHPERILIIGLGFQNFLV